VNTCARVCYLQVKAYVHKALAELNAIRRRWDAIWTPDNGSNNTVIMLNICVILGEGGWNKFPPPLFFYLRNLFGYWIEERQNQLGWMSRYICTLRSGSNQSSLLSNYLTWLLTPMVGFAPPLPSPPLPQCYQPSYRCFILVIVTERLRFVVVWHNNWMICSSDSYVMFLCSY
jgi:hypothetical protein